MSKTIRVREAEKLNAISEFLHDCRFDAEQITFDPATCILTIPFERDNEEEITLEWRVWFVRRIRVSTVRCYLRIHNVDRYYIVDTAHIGCYEFNELDYEPQARCISINATIPMSVSVTVHDFEVSVDQTDQIIKSHKVLAIGGNARSSG